MVNVHRRAPARYLPEVSLGPDGKFSVCLYGDFDGARDHDQGLYIEAESLNELATKLDGVLTIILAPP